VRIGCLTAVLFLAAAWGALADTRAPQVAGQFYPADASELRRVVTDFLSRQPTPASSGKPRVLVSPHAGYRYSGPIAARAFRQVQGQHYDGVVVVGFTHRLQFDGASVDDRNSYETPLGAIPVDLEAVQFLQARDSSLRTREEAHASGEHSLEVMLPFLQVALGESKLVPILIGSASLEQAEVLAEALAALAQQGDYLFVFSTDLSHYHPYDEAGRIDERTVSAMLYETPQALARLFRGGHLEACGQGPILASALLAVRLGYLKPELLAYANSGDTAGDRSRVVGYAALAMSEREALSSSGISEEAGMALVKAARLTLDMHLNPSKYENRLVALGLDKVPELSRAQGIFVTLRRKGLLCGCIGRIETDEPLATSLPLVALDAALRDPRFPPVRGEDLDEIHIEVSVLTPPTRLADVQDLVAGRDGVVLEHLGRRGVFLPTVWKETGWTRVEFLRELASQKAGLDPDAWKDAALYVFQDQVFEEPRLPSAEDRGEPSFNQAQDGSLSEVEGEPLPEERTAH
jgi:AmmeMemoRadiSam system protein B/AmmeMemoRadiSam system protein A